MLYLAQDRIIRDAAATAAADLRDETNGNMEWESTVSIAHANSFRILVATVEKDGNRTLPPSQRHGHMQNEQDSCTGTLAGSGSGSASFVCEQPQLPTPLASFAKRRMNNWLVLLVAALKSPGARKESVEARHTLE